MALGLLSVVGAVLTLQGPASAPPTAPQAVSHAREVAILDSLEALELTFFRDWLGVWRLSETRRHGALRSENEEAKRNPLLHCHPSEPTAPTAPMPHGVTRAGRGGTSTLILDARRVQAMVKDQDSWYALCPTWMFSEFPDSDEHASVDAALMPGFLETARGERENLIDTLAGSNQLLPRNDWIEGQLVRLLVDQRDLDSALAVTQHCGATRWWCLALAGYVRAHRGDVVGAESEFDAALAVMPRATRCEWTDLTELIDLPDRPAYLRLSCAQRDSANVRLWWLADPLYIEPGNERRVEQFSRSVLVALHAALDRDERYDWRAGGGLNPLQRTVARYGWPTYVWWGGAQNEQSHASYLAEHFAPMNATYTTFEYSFGRMHAFPRWRAVADPLKARANDWQISIPDTVLEGAWWPREHFAPHAPLLQLPDGQLAYLRRQTFAIMAYATDVDGAVFSRSERHPIAATMVATEKPGVFREIAHAAGSANVPLILRSDMEQRPALVSIEFPGVDSIGYPGGRTRFGVAPPAPLSAMKPGQFAISDPVFLVAPSANDILPSQADAALKRMAGSTAVQSSQRLGLYWETYGFKPTDSVTVAVWIERYTSQGIVRRLGIALNVTTDLNTPIAISWAEPHSDRIATFIPGPVPILGRSLTIDTSALPAGDYWLDVAIAKPGQQALRGRRGFTIP